MKRSCTQILALILLISLLAGCGVTPAEPELSQPTPAPTAEQTEAADREEETEQTPSAAAAEEQTQPESDPDQPETDPEQPESDPEQPETDPEQPVIDPDQPAISWATAFRNESVPEGVLTEDSVAFMHKNGDGTVRVFNVPKEELYAQQPEHLPRTRFFEQYMPQELIDELLPVLDYAVANGCSRFCIPATSVSYTMIKRASRYLAYTYDINYENKIDALPIKSIRQDEGTLNYLLITISAMETGYTSERYPEGLAAAQAIVDAMPEGLDEQGKMLYLYRYLTDHVRYDEDNYYGYFGESNWCLLYDSLVLHNTVCTGYSEALYVLCNLAGIDCIIVGGEVGELLSVGLHAWNVARVNGTYYEFDATWDAGKPPADYLYFGMSAAYSNENHTRLMTSFDREICPPCPEDLFPAAFFPESQEDPALMIMWYYRLCNARDYFPEKIFDYFGYPKDEIQAEEPKDGWISTQISTEEFKFLLGTVMTYERMLEFTEGYMKDDGNGMLMVRAPEETPLGLRLIDAKKNVDGSWTASLLEMAPDGSFTPREQRITLLSYRGYWLVDTVK